MADNLPVVMGSLEDDINQILERAQNRDFPTNDDKLYTGAVFNRKSDRMARVVSALSGYGATKEEIASVLRLPEKTIDKFYSEEMKEGLELANLKIKKNIIKACLDGDKKMLQFYAKTQLGWKETTKVEKTVVTLTKEQRDAMVKAAKAVVIDV